MTESHDDELDRIRAKMMEELREVPGKGATPTVPVTVTDADLDAFVRDHELVLLDMWAPWCGPCHMVAPILEDLAAEMPELTVGKVNVDENQRSAQRFDVRGIPTLLLFRDGELVNRVTGAAPRPQLERWIRGHTS